MNNATISVEEIVSYFEECNGLLGKPKLFFIQACRGDGGIEYDGTNDGYKKSLCPPKSSDILVAYSTMEGKPSFRHTGNGSWFIQTLIEHFNTYAHSAHLMDMMTVVNKEIAESELDGYRAMPQQVSTLTKFVYFKMAKVGKLLEGNNEDGQPDRTYTRPKYRSIFNLGSDRTVERTKPRWIFSSEISGEANHTDTTSRRAGLFSNNVDNDQSSCVVM